MFFKCLIKSFFRNFSNVLCSLNFFEGYSIQAKMSCSKFQLYARMERKNLPLDEKMVIDYANKNPKKGCRMIAEHFSIEKTYVSNIFSRAQKLFRGNMNFSKEIKKLRHGQYHLINKILIARANVFPDGSMLKKEAMLIKERLKKD